MPDEPNPVEIRPEDIDLAADQPLEDTDDSIDHSLLLARFIEVANNRDDLQDELNQAKIATIKILNDLMTPYAKKVFWFMCAYCGFVALFLLMNSFGCFKRPAEASVMEFLVGSTAATVVGLVGMVVTGLFLGARK